MRSFILVLSFLILGGIPLCAQCGGNGTATDLTLSPLATNSTVDLGVSGTPGLAFFLFISGGPASLPFPGFGTVCLDLTSPSFQVAFQGTIPGMGSQVFSLPIGSDPALLSALGFIQAATLDATAPGGLGLTQAHRIDFELPDSYVSMPSFTQDRMLSAAARLDDGRVVVAGGGSGWLLTPLGTSSVDIFDPYLRTITPGPAMSALRSIHTATKLIDGRILVCGGVSDLLGTVTPTCEIYDPAANAWMAAPSMGTPRAGHTATPLPDGRVLVAGGVSTFTGTIGQILNSAASTAELFNPTLGTWTQVPGSMAAARFTGAATLLNDGRVLLSGGISGATSVFGNDLPSLTASCSYFNPTTTNFSPAPPLPTAVTGHQMTTLASGNVWSTGGASSGFFSAPAAIAATRVFNGTSWSTGPSLPASVFFHSQVRMQDNRVQVFGGVSGDILTPIGVTAVARFNGSTVSTPTSLPNPRGATVSVLLENGSVFLGGGVDATGVAENNTLLYTPAP